MADSNSTLDRIKETNLTTLQTTITDMDAFSQSGFSQIAAIAKLMMRNLEVSGGHVEIMEFITLLNSIWEKAEDSKNYINCEAENVGCNYVDDVERKRSIAIHAYIEAMKEVAA